MFVSSIAALVMLLLVSLSPVQATDIYRCKDGAGNTVFQDLPCEGGDTPVISWSGSRSAAPGISSGKEPLPPLSAAPAVQGRASSQAVPAAVSDGGDKHFFWQATKKGHGTLYLLGSIHFGRPEMYPLPAVIRDAFARSDALVVELDALNMNPMVMAQSFAAKGMYLDGGSLKGDVDNATWGRLTRVAADIGLAPEMLAMQRPWMAAMTLGAMSVKRAGFSEGLGIDMHFLKQARGKLQVIELESMAMQAQLLSSLPLDSQLAMLADTLRILEEGPAYYQRMVDAWQHGEVAALEGLVAESLSGDSAAAHLHKVMLDERNAGMVAKLTALSSRGQSHFVVVGAAHLIGSSGLVEMLRRQGYLVEQL